MNDTPENSKAENSKAKNSDKAPKLDITTSRQFVGWLAETGASLAFTTYQAGKVFLIGSSEAGRLSIFERTLERCMGMCVHDDDLYIAGLYQIYHFVNALSPGETANSDGGTYDRLYIPQNSWYTADLDAHDVAIDGTGRVLFANTLFGCVAEISESHSFKPVWRPPFIDRLAAEDRCHLNGIALRDGALRYVTVVGETNSVDGWRDHRVGGGCVLDTDSGEAVVRGLSMPHSPRWHDGRLWVHDSGSGRFGFVDLEQGCFEAVAFCPGYLRGVAFIDGFAVIGVSKCRKNRTFSGLPLDDALSERKAEARCGLYVVDLKSGDVVHWLRIEGIIEELYDVCVLPGVHRPSLTGFKSDEIRRLVTIEGGADETAPPANKKTSGTHAKTRRSRSNGNGSTPQ